MHKLIPPRILRAVDSACSLAFSTPPLVAHTRILSSSARTSIPWDTSTLFSFNLLDLRLYTAEDDVQQGSHWQAVRCGLQVEEFCWASIQYGFRSSFLIVTRRSSRSDRRVRYITSCQDAWLRFLLQTSYFHADTLGTATSGHCHDQQATPAY